MNSKLDLKIKSAVSEKKRHTYLLTALTLAIFSGLVFLLTFINNETNSREEDELNIHLPLDSLKNKKSAKIELAPAQVIEDFSYSEAKSILEVISGKKENKTFYSSRAQELLELLDGLDRTSWSDKRRAESIVERVEKFIKQINVLETEYIQNLTAAFSNRDVGAFESNLKSLKGISYDEAIYNKWTEALGKLEKIKKVSLRAVSARVVNDLKNELDALNNLKVLTTLEPEEEDRLRSLEASYRELRYNEYIKESKNYLTLKQYFSAKKATLSALAIFAERKEAIALQEQIEFEMKYENFTKAVQAANKFIEDDNWLDAEEKLKSANLSFPTDDNIREKLNLSRTINRLIDELKFLIKQPMRLNDTNVREYALNLIGNNTTVFGKSNEAKKLKNDLLKLLEELKVPREINLISDGRARIEIKKVGYIEPTSNKMILLYPGSYEFVAKCKSHKDNFKKVKIPIDETKIVVRIGCGEQI